jgi:hypothetical protein
MSPLSLMRNLHNFASDVVEIGRVEQRQKGQSEAAVFLPHPHVIPIIPTRSIESLFSVH